MFISSKKPLARALIVAVAALFLAASQADARAGRGGGGFGSRGSRTFQAPPATPTAPRPAAPIDRSVTQPGQTANPAFQRPASPTAPRSGFFSTRGGFMGGLIGAGLFGMLLGYGLFGGLGGLGSILGLLLQVALVVFLVRLALRYFQRRAQPGLAGAGGPAGSGPGIFQRTASGPVATAPRGTPAGGATAARGREEVPITQADLDTFERLLQALQQAYGKEDVNGLRAVATPEIVTYLGEELAQNAARGVVNHVEDVRLLQGDVAESWREDGIDYATVAMRFGLRDWTTERATGRVVEGDPSTPTEATEIWTFQRPRGGSWKLGAIQQA
jgi:predicted lipid-binding transport protein (Tim44 family)